MASYATRFSSAKSVSKHEKRIRVSDFEQKHGLQYTYATLSALKERYPDTQFVWIMGADNLAGFHRWQKWRSIINIMPIVVFDRTPFSHTALRSKAALALKSLRLPESRISAIANTPGRWAYMYILARRHSASSTEIRKRRKRST
jgi:nicotinate-nucleotide adenylyltransferase